MTKRKKAQMESVLGFGAFVLALGVFTAGFWSSNSLNADTTNFTLTVTGGTLSIDGPDTIPFGTVNTSNVLQNIDVDISSLPEKFYVYDFKGADGGYTTTLESSIMSGVNTSGAFVGSIPASNIYVYEFVDEADLETGAANADVVIPGDLDSVYTPLDSPVTYIKRDTGANLGRVGTYSDQNRFRVVVPTWQQIGSYTAVLTRTLYDNAP